MSSNLGKTEDAKKYIKEAFRYVDGLTERERFFTRGAYYRLMGDNTQCAKEYGELLARFPADSAARANRAACLYTTNIRQALEEMQQAIKVLPNHVGYRINLALIADRASEFQTAEDELKPLPQFGTSALLALAYSQIRPRAAPGGDCDLQEDGVTGSTGAVGSVRSRRRACLPRPVFGSCQSVCGRRSCRRGGEKRRQSRDKVHLIGLRATHGRAESRRSRGRRTGTAA